MEQEDMNDEMLDALDEIYANANRLVASVQDDQWEDKTPCTEWNVRDLVDHMTGTSRICYAAATRTDLDASAGAGNDGGGAGGAGAGNADDGLAPGRDQVAEFAAAAAATAAAWRGAGALDGMVSVPAEMPAVAALAVNIIDIGTHTWDLGTAIGRDHALSPEIVALIDQWNRKVVSDDVRAGGGFGDILEPESGDGLVEMLAFVGRQA
jgi:uncharacterized protein (TIGR03086 family)